MLFRSRMYPQAFNSGAFQFNFGSSDWESGRRISLTHNDLSLLVIGNFKSDQTATAFPNFPKSGMWHNVLTGEQKYIGFTNEPITLQPGQVLVFADRKIDFPSNVENVELTDHSIVFPTVTSDRVWITDEGFTREVRLYTLQGQLVTSWMGTNEIDLSAQPDGVYILQMSGSSGFRTQKLIRK